MKSFLFGTSLSLRAASGLVTELTGQPLQHRDNDWYGDYFGNLIGEPIHVQIIRNAPDPEGYMPEDDFTEPAVLVYVYDPPAEIEARLLAASDLQLLRLRER
jgi:hypothetical protein